MATTPLNRASQAALLVALFCTGAACDVVRGQAVPATAPPAGIPPAGTPPTSTPLGTTQRAPTTAGPADFSDVHDRVSPAVVRISALTCDRDGTGSGFLVGPNLVVTAAHVVDGAAALLVSIDGDPHQARVVGLAPERDLALVEIERSAGARLEFAAADPDRAAEVAALGHPRGGPLRMTEGVVTDPDATGDLEGRLVGGLIATTVPVQPGSSGGPLVDADGAVVGVVIARSEDAATSYAIPVSDVAPRLDDPASLAPPTEPACANPLGPDDGHAAPLAGLDVLDPDLRNTFTGYFGSINAGDYAGAHSLLSPRAKAANPYPGFAEGLSTTFDFAFTVDTSEPLPDLVVRVGFTSFQAPRHGPDGENCTHWSMEYQLVPAANRLLIDRATVLDRRPCP